MPKKPRFSWSPGGKFDNTTFTWKPPAMIMLSFAFWIRQIVPYLKVKFPKLHNYKFPFVSHLHVMTTQASNRRVLIFHNYSKLKF